MSTFNEVIFKGKRLIDVDGALTTPERYENGQVSYAHFYPRTGEIWRFNESQSLPHVWKTILVQLLASGHGRIADGGDGSKRGLDAYGGNER